MLIWNSSQRERTQSTNEEKSSCPLEVLEVCLRISLDLSMVYNPEHEKREWRFGRATGA